MKHSTFLLQITKTSCEDMFLNRINREMSQTQLYLDIFLLVRALVCYDNLN